MAGALQSTDLLDGTPRSGVSTGGRSTPHRRIGSAVWQWDIHTLCPVGRGKMLHVGASESPFYVSTSFHFYVCMLGSVWLVGQCFRSTETCSENPTPLGG